MKGEGGYSKEWIEIGVDDVNWIKKNVYWD